MCDALWVKPLLLVSRWLMAKVLNVDLTYVVADKCLLFAPLTCCWERLVLLLTLHLNNNRLQ